MTKWEAELQKLIKEVDDELTKLLVPPSSDADAERNEERLNDLSAEIRTLIVELRKRAPTRGNPELRETARLLRRVENKLKDKGLNAMQVGEKFHELTENLLVPREEANAAFELMSHRQATIAAAPSPEATHLPISQIVDSATAMATLGWIFIAWAFNKVHDKKKRG